MNVLIVGLGSIARKHITVLKVIFPDLSLYALRSTKNAKNEEGISNLYSIDDLGSLALDFVIISNPTANHKQTIEQLIPYQIPLFIEKPVFNNLNADIILQQIRKINLTTYVACNLRFLGCIQFVKQFVIDKRINEVNSYCGSYLPDWRPGQDFRNIYSANIEMGGGVHIDLIHEIDYLYWLFGKPEQIYSNKTNRSSLNISAVDYANYLFIYNDFCTNVVLNYYRRDPKRSLEILLEEGTLYVDLLENKVTFNDEVIYISNKRIIDTYEDQLRFFVGQVLKNKVKFNSIEEAFEVLKLCIAND